jgi:hypothetical protein
MGVKLTTLTVSISFYTKLNRLNIYEYIKAGTKILFTVQQSERQEQNILWQS